MTSNSVMGMASHRERTKSNVKGFFSDWPPCNGKHIGFIQTFGRSEEAADGDFALMRQLAKLVFGGVNAQFAEAGGHMDGAEEILHSLDAEKGGFIVGQTEFHAHDVMRKADEARHAVLIDTSLL